jgi:carboxymethylenebutenolidase
VRGTPAPEPADGLGTDKEDSPQLLSSQMDAAFLIAIAESDDERNPNEKVLLREAFDAAGVKAEIEVCEGTSHGWCPPDPAVHYEAQADRAWSRLLARFECELSSALRRKFAITVAQSYSQGGELHA